MLTINWDDTNAVIDTVYALEVGDVFRTEKDIQGLCNRIEERRVENNTLTSFTVATINPGTELFVVYSTNSLIVTGKVL